MNVVQECAWICLLLIIVCWSVLSFRVFGFDVIWIMGALKLKFGRICEWDL